VNKSEDKIKRSKITRFVLSRLFSPDKLETTLGDFEEGYLFVASEKGKIRASLWYLMQILNTLIGKLYNSLYWSVPMFKNYMKIAMRNIEKQKFFSLINILGLTTGMTCFILIALYIKYETSFDKYHKNSEDIYRVVVQHSGSFMGTNKWTWTPDLLAPTLKENFPEVIETARIDDENDIALSYGNRSFSEDRFCFVDQGFLNMFSFIFIDGDPETALIKPFSMLLTEKMAKKYFGDENPVGMTIRYNNEYDFTLTGVLKDVPGNSHFKFDFLASFITLRSMPDGQWMNSWNSSNYQTYLRLQENSNPEELGKRFTEHISQYVQRSNVFILQPLTDIHLSGTVPGELEENGEIKYIYIFSVIAFFILLIACCNFMNLSTARSAKRSMEVGMRKVAGATRKQIIYQFFGESVIISFIAFFISLLLVYIFLPQFSSAIDRNLTFSVIFNMKILFGLIGITILVGLISGCYPALFISSFQPEKIIKGDCSSGSKRSLSFRNTLVLVQFIISICLIISTIIVYRQLHFIRNKDIGYEKENIIALKVSRSNKVFKNNISEFKNELLKNPGIKAVSTSYWLPTYISSGDTPVWDEQTEEQRTLFHNHSTDYDFVDVYGIEIIQGRNFSKDITTDLTEAYLVNETAVEVMGIEDPVGKRFGYNYRPGVIIGVVRDFHFVPMTLEIRPLAIRLDPTQIGHVSIKINSSDLKNTLSFIEEKWGTFSPGFPFNYSFIDERFDRIYKADLKLGRCFGYFTFIAIFLACLGLFGLVLFTTEQKTKEIGIRKVLGASIKNIVYLVTKDFLKWIALASCLSLPIAWYAMNQWLNKYAYRINIGVGTFVFAIVLVMSIVIMTIGYHSFKAARTNPVESLKYE